MGNFFSEGNYYSFSGPQLGECDHFDVGNWVQDQAGTGNVKKYSINLFLLYTKLSVFQCPFMNDLHSYNE